jgi:hypothetical protein
MWEFRGEDGGIPHLPAKNAVRYGAPVFVVGQKKIADLSGALFSR